MMSFSQKMIVLVCITIFGAVHGLYARQEVPQEHDLRAFKDSLEIGKIEVYGNKVTKKWVVLREMELREGSKVHEADLDSLLKLESNKIFNTNLFITAEALYNTSEDGKANITVTLIERAYTFPIPIIDVGDRNFNEWWQKRNKDFSRLVYGFTFKRSNFRGRNETLNIAFRLGFRQSLRLEYKIPFINKRRTVGLSAFVDYTTRNVLAYQTDANQLAFVSTEGILRKDFNAIASVWRRRGYYTTHKIALAYRRQHVSDTIFHLNPYYLNLEGNQARFLELGYTYTYDFRNAQNYPTKGYYLEIEARQRGFGLLGELKQTSLSVNFAKYVTLSKMLYFSARAKAKFSNNPSVGYVYSNGIGYREDIVRGYDLYVVDGQQAFYARNTLRLKVFDKVVKASFIPLKAFDTMPLAFYPKVFFDTGYVRNSMIRTENERFANTLLKGWGVGLDAVSFYGSVLRLEYSMNKEGDKGMFFYWTTGF